MPQNKRESLIFTFMMCFVMVFVMSIYNVSVFMGGMSGQVIREAWLGFPLAYVVAMALDWFIISHMAKKVAFTFLIKSHHGRGMIAVIVSCCMVMPMVIVMSLYGAAEACVRFGGFHQLINIWGRNILINVIVALPLQLLIAGPLVRIFFRRIFPEGKVLA